MRYLGIDFGLKRIGLAISEGEFSSPFKIITVLNFKDSIEKVTRIISYEKVDKVIIGLPEGKTGKIVLKFINALKKTGIYIQPFDETLSSREALNYAIDMNIPKKKRRQNDNISASIILQNYLDLK